MTPYVSMAPPTSPFHAKTKPKALVLPDLTILAQDPPPSLGTIEYRPPAVPLPHPPYYVASFFQTACPKLSPGSLALFFWPQSTAPTDLIVYDPPPPPTPHLTYPSNSCYCPQASFLVVHMKLSPGALVFIFWPETAAPTH